jgi:hypothetical protein
MSTTGGNPVESIVRQILLDLSGNTAETFAGSALSPQPYLPPNRSESKPPALKVGEKAAPEPPSSGPAKAPEQNEKEKVSADEKERELRVDSRVVTLTELGEELTAARRLIVPAKAVVTPAVRDVLRKKRIELRFQNDLPEDGHSGRSEESRSVARLLMAAHARELPGAAALESVERLGPIDTRADRCLIGLVRWIAETLREQPAVGVILTEAIAAAICLANRQGGVRAVGASEVRPMIQAAKSVGANVLVFDPAKVGNYRLKVLLQEFRKIGPLECPTVFQDELG